MKTYVIKTFGCQMNFSDSERIRAFLNAQGLKEVEAIDNKNVTPKLIKADLVIMNTCGVRQTAENRVYGLVHNIREKKPGVKILITGCLAHRKDFQKRISEITDIFVPIKGVISALEELLAEDDLPKRKIIECNPDAENSYLSITPEYIFPHSIFVPIMTGCNNFCSYCVVPYARGREWSRPKNEIIDEITAANQQTPLKNVLLLGQNVNSYRYKTENETIGFPTLLAELAEKFPSVTFDFLTSHPKDFSDELIEVIAKHGNISRKIHLPFQAGSDRILKAMNRKYTQEHYLGIIEKIKKGIPDAKISTDVIVGFPGETEEDFQESVKIFERVDFTEAYINKYSPRPGTKSFEMEDDVSWEEKRRREKILRDLRS